MLTTSHAYWTYRLAGARAGAGWAVLGAVAPDLPAAVLAGFHGARGVPRSEMLDRAYHGRARHVHMTAHSLLAPLALGAAARRRSLLMFAAGWAGHVLVDLLTHHDDAWPPAWPLSRRRFPGPVSYWQREHHARAWSAFDATALAAAALSARGARRVAGLLAAALATGPLLAPAGEDMWTALGARPDADARGRDL